MRLEGTDGVSELEVTLAGYEFPDAISDRETMNWLEVDLRVRTPHGWGISRVACMRTWDAAGFADWLESLNESCVGIEAVMLFPEPNLQMKAVEWPQPHHVRIDIIFILEQPGQWEMDNASKQSHYVGNMSLKTTHSALRAAAESLRADLRRFPVREPSV